MRQLGKTSTTLGVLALSLALGTAAALAAGSVERLYVMNCGEGHAPDQSRWSPGVNVGKPLDVVDNCYLIHHGNDYLMWDTGLADAIADIVNPQPPAAAGATDWRRSKKLAAQLAEIGVAPDAVRYVAISHTHPDHIGNVELFPRATLLVQKAEYEWPTPLAAGRFKPEHPVEKLEGDRDVFGDGSVVIISTPGHTPGHQSLLVRLAKTGAVVLSGDAVHFKDNWDNKRVPPFNFDKEKSAASLQRIADVLAENKAELWINHDKQQSDTQMHSPKYYE